MLRPQDTATRERVSLDGLWHFRLDVDGVGHEQAWQRGPLAEARQMAVPASFNDLTTDAATRDFFGNIWYQRTIRIPRGWDGERIVLYVESATHRATVWLDDVEVGSHEGGYLPFECDLTDHVRAGRSARLTICVNNTLSFQSIPPGVIEDSPTGPKQIYWHDFFNYAGLHRLVWLTCRPAAHIDDVTVVTGFTREGESVTGSVRYEVETVGGAATRVRLLDETGRQVAQGSEATGELTVSDARSCGSPAAATTTWPSSCSTRPASCSTSTTSTSTSAPCASTASASSSTRSRSNSPDSACMRTTPRSARRTATRTWWPTSS